MLLPGTQMHILTFSFICFEIVLIIHLIAYKLARPINKTLTLDICLLTILIIYNICGGLLPDPNLPGNYVGQESIAYGTGFLAPAFFSYYVWKGFGLAQMRSHINRGIYFLVFPYIAFTIILISTRKLEIAEYVLVIPMFYGIWVLVEVIQNVYTKYNRSFANKEIIEELIILIVCLAPWVGLPLLTYYNIPQHIEVALTNSGFLMLLALHVKQTIIQLRQEHQRPLQSKIELEKSEVSATTLDEKIQTNTSKYPLTNREKEIALLLCKGYTHQQIAERLFISPRTVGKHVENLFEKLAIANRFELVHKLSV